MRRIATLFALPLAALLLALPATPVHAQAEGTRLVSGDVPGGGRYQLAVPPGWQPGDALIVYNHGFTLRASSLEQDPRLAPGSRALEEWLERGYAVAAGTYSQRGWAVFGMAAHQRGVLDAFVAEAGAPGRIVLVGGSLGGLASVNTAEDFLAAGQPVDGVYALCPALAGARTWDQAADLKLVYDAVCAGVGGGEIDRGSPPPDWLVDYDSIPEDWGDRSDEEMLRLAARVTQCTGALLPEWARSSGQRERLQRIFDETGLSDVDAFLTNMAYATFALSDLVRGPDKLRGRSPFDNRFVEYADPGIDASIERVSADRYARAEFEALSDPDWRIGDARMLAIHTSGDEVLVPEHLSEVPDALLAEGQVVTALVVEEEPSHCEFGDAEFLAGFDALEEWMDGAPAPDVAALNARCEALAPTLSDDTGCRFADASALPSFDERVPPRGLDSFAPLDALQSGAWYDPATDGEGFVITLLPGRDQAAVTWYTYAPDGSGEQRWIAGSGVVHDNAIVVRDAQVFEGGGFGSAFDPAAVQGEPWGQLTFLVEGTQGDSTLRRARVRYEGPPAWGSGERELLQITHGSCGPAGCEDAGAQALWGYTGLWYRGPQAPGDGLFLQVDDQGRAVLAWYGYEPDGTPMWLVGLSRAGATPGRIEVELMRAEGAQFGEGFDPDEVERSIWGTATLEFASCDAAQLHWDAVDPAFGSGHIALERLTPAPEGSPCA